MPPYAYNPPDVPLSILHHDSALLIVDKPAGLLSVPGKDPGKEDCLIDRLRRVFPEVLLVHRLDCDTSGVMVFALTKAAQGNLGQQFEKRQTKKIFLARLAGRLDHLEPLLRAALGIAIDAVFFHPHGGGQHEIGELGGGGRIDVGNDEELVLQPGFRLIEFFQIRQRLAGVGHLHHDGVDVAALVCGRAEFLEQLHCVIARGGIDAAGGQVPVFFALLAVRFLRHKASAGQRVAKRADLAGSTAGGRLAC